MTSKGDAPLVSVVIPCYNQAHLLSDAIESALAQTHSRMDIIVVDDGSPDDTAKVAARYPAIRCVRQQNEGLSGARNTGFRASNGDFVLFLDADDRLTPPAVDAHLRCFVEHPEAGFVVGEIDHIAMDGSYKGSPRWTTAEASPYEELLKANHVANTIAVMFRRFLLQSVGEFDKSCAAGADYDILLRAARLFPSAHHRTVVAQYRRHNTNMSRTGVLMLRTMLRIMHSQRRCVKGNLRLEAACRRGANYWRDRYGAVTVKEIYGNLRRRELARAAQASVALIWHVRERLLLLLWKHRRRILRLDRS